MTSINYSTDQDSGNDTKQKAEPLSVQKDKEEYCEVVVFWQDKHVIMKSQGYVCLHKTTPVNIPAWVGERFEKAHSHLKSYEYLMPTEGERLVFYREKTKWSILHPCAYGQY